jgi:hypothetical protein
MSFLALLLAHLAVSGCGSSSNTIWVTGKLQKGGATYTPPAGQKLEMTFYAMEVIDETGKKLTNAEPYLADLNPEDGTFSVPGAEGKGIPPGKYRVAISQRLTRDAVEKASKAKRKVVNRDADSLASQFGMATSPIMRDLTSSCEVTIDMDHPMPN